MDSEARFERIERTMEFLAHSQARFDANQTRFDANQVRFEENQVRFDARMVKISEDLETVIRTQQGQLEVLDTVLVVQRKNEIGIRELIEKGKHTEDNLNALIKVVDGLITQPPR